MFKRIIAPVLSVIVLSLAASGCKSEGTESAPATGAPAAGTGTTPAAAAGTGTMSAAGTGATAAAGTGTSAAAAGTGSMAAAGTGAAATAGTAAAAAGAGAAGSGMMSSAATGECAQITTDSTLSQANCNNAADKCFLLAHAGDVRKLGGECATKTSFMVEQVMVTGCLQFVAKAGTPEAVKCFTDCLDLALKTKFKESVSPPCLICPSAVATCSTSTDAMGNAVCVGQCITEPDSTACTECLCAQHPNGIAMGKPGSCLIGAYADCTGFRPTPEQVSCPAGSK